MFRKRKTAEADGMLMPEKLKTAPLIPGRSGQNASLGGVSGFTVEITQQPPIGPGGSSSKFSLQIVPVHGVAVGVGVGVGGGVGVGVLGVGEGPPVGEGP